MKSAGLATVYIIFLLSCGVVKKGTYPAAVAVSSTTKPTAVSVAAVSTPEGAEARRKKLDEAFTDWKGIPYILGGTDYSGVDCSSFMQIVFEDYFGIKLPRNTREQMSAGSTVTRGNIRIGDLIFFNTGRKTLHVGVALNGNEFLHASTTAGVTISKLNDTYWDKAYLTTRRVM